MSLPAYPSYTASGVEWLLKYPDHWELKPNKAFLQPRKSEVGQTWSEKTLLSLTLNGVIARDVESGKGKFPADFGTYQDVSEGDLIFCLFDIDETPRTVGLAPAAGMITGAYDVFRCRVGTNPRYVLYYYLHVDSFKGLRPFYTGLRKVVRPPTFMSLKVPLPPWDEQNSIVSFLDQETAKIDELVAEQQRLIELLKEKRQAVISHAVTKGLNSHALMKPSGIEWLGDVPAHWRVLPLRRAIDFLTDYEANGSFADTKVNVRLDSGAPYAWYVRATDIEQKRFGFVEGNRFCDESSYKWLQKTALQGGELLVAKRGEIGKVYVMPELGIRATLAPNLYLIRLNHQLHPRYALHWFSVDPGNAELALANKSTTIGALYKDDVRSCIILLPPIDEQAAIIAQLEKDIAESDSLIAEAQRAIELLQERRTALISAAVTGQIDVRRLPELPATVK